MGLTIAIDGPSGAGKSTVARMLAGLLGFHYLDTGALYRAVALGLVRAGVSPDEDDNALTDVLAGFRVSFRDGQVFLGDENVTEEVRNPQIGHFASVFSARRPVREFLLPVQKKAAEASDLVVEGRDMATVVFPQAWRKFFLDATLAARARRRYEQLRMSGVPVSLERAAEDVEERDRRDSSRDLAPLARSPGAVFIDTSDMSVEDVVRTMLEYTREKV